MNSDEEFVNLYDLGSPLYRKCIFTFKYKTLTEQNMTLEEMRQCQMTFNNAISHDRFFTQKHITLKSARMFALNNDNSLVISFIFLLKNQSLFKSSNHATAIQKDKVFHSSSKYLLYTREVSK